MADLSVPNPDFFCSALSRQEGERMVGTAQHVQVWFLLEYVGVWEARATEENDLPRPGQAWLAAQVEALMAENLPGRVQFIKQGPAYDVTPGVTFFIGVNDEAEPRLYRFQLDGYEELLTLDVPAIVAGDAAFARYRHDAPLYLVCTNGKRDRCCALYGQALAEALAARAGDAVWQTTHLGGHRFAPTLITFPDATYYGRLAPEDVDGFLAAHRRGELFLDNLRGRTCYPQVVQAADGFLRQATGRVALGAFRHVATEPFGDGRWQVWFAEQGPGRVHAVTLLAEEEALPVYASCGKIQPKMVTHYQLIQHKPEGDNR